ncbi:MAG: 6-phosphofructokinase [Limisphaerales bacterium]
MQIPLLGEPRFPSPIGRAVDDALRVPEHVVYDPRSAPSAGLSFELAGPRDRLFFDPRQTRAGIVTCGGLCPGLNDVVHSLFLELHHAYRVREVLGYRGGSQGLGASPDDPPVVLDTDWVDSIHQQGGSVLGTSRGPVDVPEAVDQLIRREVNILFTIGGDGTQRGANELAGQARARLPAGRGRDSQDHRQ